MVKFIFVQLSEQRMSLSRTNHVAVAAVFRVEPLQDAMPLSRSDSPHEVLRSRPSLVVSRQFRPS